MVEECGIVFAETPDGESLRVEPDAPFLLHLERFGGRCRQTPDLKIHYATVILLLAQLKHRRSVEDRRGITTGGGETIVETLADARKKLPVPGPSHIVRGNHEGLLVQGQPQQRRGNIVHPALEIAFELRVRDVAFPVIPACDSPPLGSGLSVQSHDPPWIQGNELSVRQDGRGRIEDAFTMEFQFAGTDPLPVAV